MTAQNLLFVTTILALLSTGLFVLTYAVRARSGWWRDPLGRALMLAGVAVFTLCGVGTIRRFNTAYFDSDELQAALLIASSVAYVAIALTWAYKSYTVLKETEPPENENGPARRQRVRRGGSTPPDQIP